ncbi:mitochondrial ribosomal protein L35 [Lycorma delicatula]|uniref:mitochondrial ribosomal protein L35 n=1 Tax=Lycorma delicatula TaxID=130591 RepID=UPI003F50F829
MLAIRQIWRAAFSDVIHKQNYAILNSQCLLGKQGTYSTNLFNFARSFINPVNNSISYFRPQLLERNCQTEIIQQRNVTQYSKRSGKRTTVKAVLKRFYRLDWGIWIRTKCGRHKKLYKKSSARKRRLREHVFCNAQQSNLLDKMVTKFWKRPKYYVDDPYEPYHKREEFLLTRKQPLVKNVE